jgi:antirestriction protein ArdC
MRTDVYERITNQIVAELDRASGRPWLKPWNAGQADGDLVRRRNAISDICAPALRDKAQLR